MPSLSERSALALLAASCLVLAGIDYLIPKPIPFLRLGLANLPILIAVAKFRPKLLIALGVVKIIGQGLLTGMLFSYVFLFSATGTVVSILVMALLQKLFSKYVSLVGVSVAGALASNSAQLFLAATFIFGRGAWLFGPPFLLIGLLTSLILGYIAEIFVRESRWLTMIDSGGVR